jgi:hypothetical protein
VALVKALGMMINFCSWAGGLSGRQQPAGFTQRHRLVTAGIRQYDRVVLIRNSDLLNSQYPVMAANSALFHFL